MNVVLAEEAAEIAGVEPGPMFRQTPHRGLGEQLRELLLAVDELGYSGDRLLTDAGQTNSDLGSGMTGRGWMR